MTSKIKSIINNIPKYKKDSDLPTMVSYVGIMLRLVSVNINKGDKKRIHILSYIFVISALLCYLYVYFFSVLWFLFVRTPQTRDWTAGMVELSLAACSEVSVFKIVYAILFTKRIQDLVQSYLQLNAMTPPGDSFTRNLQGNLRKIKKRIMIIWSALTANGVIYLAVPLIIPGRHFPEDLFVVYGLEPMFESPNFEIAYFMMNLSVFFTVYSLANVTALILIFVGYTEAQMLTLADEMLNLWDDANHFARTKCQELEDLNFEDMKNVFVNKQLTHIAKFHIANIDRINKLEDTFRLSKAIEFFIGVLSIITELLGGIENTYVQIPYTFMLIYIDCLAGQRLIDACQVFEQATYSCNWERFNKENMKTVLIILQNSQKTLTLTAGGITIMNYCCMVSFFKLCYSFYTTLRMVIN